MKSIELKLTEIAPDILDNMNDGVTDGEVENLEKIINAKLPTDFIAFTKSTMDKQQGVQD